MNTKEYYNSKCITETPSWKLQPWRALPIHWEVSCGSLHYKHDWVIAVHTRSLMFQWLRSGRVLSMGARPHISSSKTTPKLYTSLRSVNEFVCQYLRAWTHSKSFSWLPPHKKHKFLLGVMRQIHLNNHSLKTWILMCRYQIACFSSNCQSKSAKSELTFTRDPGNRLFL